VATATTHPAGAALNRGTDAGGGGHAARPGAGITGCSRRRAWARLALVAALLTAGCERAPDDANDHANLLALATTTSVDDSGLLDVLVPAFEAAHAGIRLRVIAVGTGQALALAQRGDADVVFVHSPVDEEAFMQSGAGRQRVSVMYNSYIIAGPASDPAGVRAAASAADAFRRIAGANERFISRGDDSGTHRREVALWREAGFAEPSSLAFRAEIGQGMGEALMMASERNAYILTDNSTHRSMRDRLRLQVLFEGGTELRNLYSVLTTSRTSKPVAADAFLAWMTSPDAAALIREHGVAEFGAPLFTVLADQAHER
jgi:tungstate transport system substrate-binding protein